MAKLRAVGPDEKPAKKKSVTEAAADGTHRELLVALRDRIARTVEDPNCSPRDLGTLSYRLQLIARELMVIDARAEVDDIGVAAMVPDEPFGVGDI